MEDIKLKIRDGKIDEAIDQLINEFSDTEYENELILLSSRNASNQRLERLGKIDFGDYKQENNNIIHSLINLIETLKREVKRKDLDDKKKVLVRKIIFCESNPILDRNLLSNVEIREIEEIINKERAKLKLIVKFGLSLNSFVESIIEFTPQIIHFTAFTDNGGIYFHDKSDNPNYISNNTFINCFKMFENQIECICFNTFISEEMAKEISSKKIFVTGFNNFISNQVAIEFATGFYTALRFGKEYLTAFEIGRQTLLNGRLRGDYKNSIFKLFAYFNNEKVILK